MTKIWVPEWDGTDSRFKKIVDVRNELISFFITGSGFIIRKNQAEAQSISTFNLFTNIFFISKNLSITQ